MARFYSNENFPHPAVEALRKLGHDIITIQERGRHNERVPDPEVLAFAVSEQRAILTLNRKDFIRLHNEDASHEGVVVCHEDRDFPRLAQSIHDAVFGHPSIAGMLIQVPKPKRA